MFQNALSVRASSYPSLINDSVLSVKDFTFFALIINPRLLNIRCLCMLVYSNQIIIVLWSLLAGALIMNIKWALQSVINVLIVLVLGEFVRHHWMRGKPMRLQWFQDIWHFGRFLQAELSWHIYKCHSFYRMQGTNKDRQTFFYKVKILREFSVLFTCINSIMRQIYM